MTRKEEGPSAREGAARAETETIKFQYEYSDSQQFRQARTRHIADIVADMPAERRAP